MLDVIFEDNHILVVVKPQNIPSQEDESMDENMVSLVKKYLKEKYNKPGNVYVGLVHRLDRPTGGIMVFAKTGKASARLTEQLQSGDMKKTYLTVVNGNPKEDEKELVNYLKKNMRENLVSVVPELTSGAKKAILNYQVLEKQDKVSLVAIRLKTGRSHQIRVQMKHIGHPVFGDARYGGDILSKGHNLALWAYKLEFNHPVTKDKLSFTVFPPEDKIPWKVFENIEAKASKIKFDI